MIMNIQHNNTPFFRAAVGLIIAVLAGMALAGTALAEPVFSQRVANPSAYDSVVESDVDGFFEKGAQMADNVTLASPATVRSVTWWGIFDDNDVPTGPVSFDVIFYANNVSNNLPNLGSILSSTNVTFSSLTDTGEQFGGDEPEDIYVFEADVPPTYLSAGTKVWFSVLADSGSTDDGPFMWRFDDGDESATRPYANRGDPFMSDVPAKNYSFVLDDGLQPLSPSYIKALSLTGGVVTLHITNLTVGATHHLLETDALSHPSWTTNGSFTASSSTTNLTTIVSGPQGFYQIKSEN